MNYCVKNIANCIKNRSARVSVLGSKSITARALLIATLASGVSTLKNAQFSDDCATFLRCVNDLGIKSEIEGNSVKIYGCGGKLPVKYARINVGSAGTAARFLTALLAFSEGEFYLDCSPQMKKRPIAPLLEALKGVGARFTFYEEENCFPFTVYGTNRASGEIKVDISKSSQYLSALLLSAPCLGETAKIRAFGGHGMDYVKMTVKMMSDFGVNVACEDGVYTVLGAYKGGNYEIEPDFSAACYFYAMNRLLGINVEVDGVKEDSLQGDRAFIELIKDFNGGRVDMSAFSDQALTLSAVAPFLDNPTEICGVGHIRGQECDRILAIVSNLRNLGVRVDELSDGVKIYPSTPHGGEVETYGDHRVAMSFALVGLRVDGVVIKNAEVCAKTFKEYFTVLDNLITHLT